MSRQVRARSLFAYIAVLALALILPALLFFAFAVERWIASEQAQLAMLTRETNDRALARLDGYLSSRIAALQALATSPALDARDFNGFDQQVRDMPGMSGVDIVLRDRAGQQYVNTRLSPTDSLPRTDLDADRIVKRAKQPYVTDLFAGPIANEPMVSVIVPVLRYGEAAYLLSASIPPRVIADLLRQTGIVEPYTAAIADRAGRIIARAPHAEEAVGQPLPGFTDAAGQRGMWEGANAQGTPVVAAYQRSELSGWLIRIGVQKAAFDAPLRRSLAILGAAAALLAAFAAAVSHFVIRRLLRSQQQLAAAVEALRTGKAVEAPVTPVLETDKVGEALSHASARLRDQAIMLDRHNKELESRVAERTRELAEHTALLQATVDNMDQGLMMSDARGTLLVCNQRAIDLLGLDPEMMARCPTIAELREYQIQQGEFARADQTFREATEGARAGAGPHTFERVRPNGTVLEIRSVLLPLGGTVRTYTDVTNQRSVEAAIRESEARYRLLADHATDMVVQADLDTTRRYVSPAARDLLGYEPEELIGTRPVDCVHPDDREALNRVLDDLTSGRTDPAVSTHRYRRKDGAYVWVEAKFRLVRDETGRPTGYVAAVRDVSDRKAAESTLLANKARYRQVLDTALDAYVAVDASGLVTGWNAAAEKVFGWPAADAVGRPLAETVIPERFRDAHGRGFARCLETGEGAAIGQRLELTALHRSGAEIPVEITISAIEVAGARTFHAFIRDISQRKARDRALVESEARYRLLAENASDIIMVREIGGPRTYVSPACLPVLGYTQEEFLSMPARALIHPDDYPSVASVYEAISPERPQTVHLHRLKHKQGRWVWVEAVFKLLDGRKRPMVLAAIRDVSERQAQSEQLRIAKDAAEQASQAKGDFLAAMSHEIRTPLNGILGYADLLLDDDGLSDGQRRHAEHIQSAGSALLTVVNDILDFSKIEAGKVDLDLRPMALPALIDNTVAIIKGVAARKRLDIRARIDPGVPEWLVGDGDRLRQVLLNLLNNAVKFTPSGSVTLTVRCEGESAAGARLRFKVADTGIGVPREKSHRMFERFSQADGSIQREFGGTGLGLAICKRLLDLMGGEIGVESEPGQGSTFWFTLTLPRAEKAGADSAPKTRAGRAGRGALILVVEDVEMNQELARAVLEAAGHKVDVVADGADAVMAVQARTYDLVLMDIQMPGMDGIAATQHIRALDHAARNVPIVAMTANVLPAQAAQIRQAGMNGFIGKPFKREHLYEAVERWAGLSRSVGERAVEEAPGSDAEPDRQAFAAAPRRWSAVGTGPERTIEAGPASAAHQPSPAGAEARLLRL